MQRLKGIIFKLLVVGILAYGYFVWPTPYKYGTWRSQAGFDYPMRTAWITGTVDLYYNGQWASLNELLLDDSARDSVRKIN